MDLTIIQAVPDEADLLNEVAFRSKRSWGYPESWLESWRDQIEVSFTRQHHIYKAVDRAGNVVGFYGLQGAGETLWLDGFWVAPEAMGQGVGRTLYTHMLQEAGKMGASSIEWDSDPNAAPFYHRMGAIHIGDKITTVEGTRRVLPLFRALVTNPHKIFTST